MAIANTMNGTHMIGWCSRKEYVTSSTIYKELHRVPVSHVRSKIQRRTTKEMKVKLKMDIFSDQTDKEGRMNFSMTEWLARNCARALQYK